MPQPKKPPDQRKRRNREPRLVVGPRPAMPDPPDGLLKCTRQRWTRYWESDAARVVKPHHHPSVERMFRLMDELERASRQVRRDGRQTVGSKGQPVLHPLLKYIDTCHVEIRQLEGQLGCSPKAELQMGIAYQDLSKSLDALNREIDEDDERHDDPRITLKA